MKRPGTTVLVVALTATCIAAAGCGEQRAHSKSFNPRASGFDPQPTQLPQGRRAAAWDQSRQQLWVLTAEDITRRMSLTSYDPVTQNSTTSVISKDDSNYVKGALTVDSSYVWAAWGSQLVRFDPRDGSTTTFEIPHALTGVVPAEVHIGDSRAVLSMVETKGHLWMNIDGVTAIAIFDNVTNTWSSESPSDSTTTPMSNLAVVGQTVWVDRRSTLGLTVQAVPAPPTAGASALVSDAAVSRIPITTFAARDAQHVAIVTTQAQLEDFDVTTGALRPSSVVVEGILPSVPMAADDAGDLWAWRRTGTGDALVHVNAALTGATDIEFSDATVDLDRNPADGTSSTSTTRLVDPAVQTVTPTPYGVFVTTRYGSDGSEKAPYASTYVVAG